MEWKGLPLQSDCRLPCFLKKKKPLGFEKLEFIKFLASSVHICTVITFWWLFPSTYVVIQKGRKLLSFLAETAELLSGVAGPFQQ